jgi:hypothetical protein
MKIDVDESYNIRVTEAYVGLIFETKEGHRYGVCMRDNTIEIAVIANAPDPRICYYEGCEMK